MNIPFIGPAYQNRSENYSSQRLVNMYLEAGKGKSPWVLIGTPGLSGPLIELSGGGIRGAYRVSQDLSIWVCGENVYKLDADLNATQIGVAPDDGEPVSIAFNGTQVIIASGGNLYAYELTGTAGTLILASVSTADVLSGYILAARTGTQNVNVSGNASGTSGLVFDPLDVKVAEGGSDPVVRILTNNLESIIFGTETTEVWYVIQSEGVPVDRIQGAFIQEGLAAKHSAVRCGDTVAWLGSNESGDSNVWMMEGYRPRMISNPAISFSISQWPDKSDAWGLFYKQEGHAFYVLSSPSANETWAYDFSTGEWHQRAYLNDVGELERIRWNTHIHFAGKNLVGDWQTGSIYELSLDQYTDNGDAIQRIRACSTIQDGLRKQRNKILQLDMDTGVGLSTGQGSDPQAMLRFSKDGGRTWSNQLWRSMGRIGEYGRRVRWTRVGGGAREVYEVIITDPIKVCITGATLT